MRSLNTSLPGGASPPKHGEPPGHLLQAFKVAALSVTHLYKMAADDMGKARSEGYQDALDDLLGFLDKEDIGLNDGEGWRIREWATARLDGRDSASQHAESDDEVAEKVDGPSSPILQRSQSETRLDANQQSTRTSSPMRTEPPIPPMGPPATTDLTSTAVPHQNTFAFRASHPYPQDADTVLSDLNSLDNNRIQTPNNPGITITRPSRTSTRHNNHSSRHSSHNTRAPSMLGRGAGQKRRAVVPDIDFFDLGNLDYGKDGFGGGKRGRYA